MSDHVFGGLWTAQKLDALRAYLEFFPIALSAQGFKLVYIDTFAGSGKCTIKDGNDGQRTIDGSARIALDVSRPFDEYHFIEARKKHVNALRALKDSHSHGDRVNILHGDARKDLALLLGRQNWAGTRGVLFLDPYGLQCTWEMVKSVAATQALDVFFLVSLSGLTRQAARSASRIDTAKAEALDRFLGTKDWRTALYKAPRQNDFFIASPTHERESGTEAILQFVHDQMETVFAYVEQPLILRGATRAPYYALFFAVSNRSQRALALTRKVGGDILNKLR